MISMSGLPGQVSCVSSWYSSKWSDTSLTDENGIRQNLQTAITIRSKGHDPAMPEGEEEEDRSYLDPMDNRFSNVL